MTIDYLLNRLILVLTLGLISGAKPFVEPITEKDKPVNTRKISDLERHFHQTLATTVAQNIAESACPGVAMAVCKDGVIIMDTVIGVKSSSTLMPIDKETAFRLGSVSKGFAGLLASKLIELGYFHPDDPVSQYIPKLTLKAKSKDGILKVRHLLSQSVGVTEHAYSNLVDRDLSIDNLIPYINKLYVRDSTGIAYAYQNATYGLIEKVIEKATGMTYKEALRTFVLDPLGMQHTTMSMEGIIESHNYCNGHKARRKPAGFAPIDISTHYYNVVSAGGVNSNLEDMEKWLQAVMGYAPDVLSEQVRNRAFYPYIWSGSASKYFNRWPEYSDSYYAWGWRRLQVGNRMLVHHGGLVNGFRTEIAFDPVENIGIVCLFNSTCDYSNQIISDFFMSWQQSMYDYTIQKVPPLNVIMKPIPIVSNVAP